MILTMKHIYMLLILVSNISIVLNSNMEYGQFELVIKEFTMCPGPKRKDCAINTIENFDEHIIDLVVDVKENMKITKGKISVATGGKETMRLQLKNPCDHIFIKPLIRSILNVTNECLMKKGHYHYSANIEDIAQKYYGGDFLFGKWTFKSTFYSESCNFSCSLITVEIVPRKSKST